MSTATTDDPFAPNYDDADKAEQQSGGGRYFKLASGQSAQGVFMGSVYPFENTWSDGSKSTRFATHIYDLATCSMQLWEMSATTYRDLKTLKEKYGLAWIFEIARKGAGTDTRYQLLPERQLTPDEVERCKVAWAGDQFDLVSEYAPTPASDDDVPF